MELRASHEYIEFYVIFFSDYSVLRVWIDLVYDHAKREVRSHSSPRVAVTIQDEQWLDGAPSSSQEDITCMKIKRKMTADGALVYKVVNANCDGRITVHSYICKRNLIAPERNLLSAIGPVTMV